jgi:hypothetical protein
MRRPSLGKHLVAASRYAWRPAVEIKTNLLPIIRVSPDSGSLTNLLNHKPRMRPEIIVR